MAALNPDPEPPPLWALRTEIPTFVADHCEDACDLAVWRAIRWLISRADRELLGIDARTIASHAKIDVKTALRSIHGDRSSSKAKRQPRRPKRGLVGLGLLEIAEYQSVGKINPRPVYRIPSWIEDQNTRYICEMLTRQGVTPQPPAPPPKQAPPPPAPPPKQAPPPPTPDLHVAPPPATPDLHVAPPPATSSAAPSPCTRQGTRMISRPGFRRCTTCSTSRIAAPVGDVTKPMRCGNSGSGRFRSCSNNPSAASFCLSFSKAICNAPTPCNSTARTMSWYCPRAS